MFTVTTRDGSEAHLNPGAMAGADVVCCRALVRPEGEDGGRVRRVLEGLGLTCSCFVPDPTLPAAGGEPAGLAILTEDDERAAFLEPYTALLAEAYPRTPIGVLYPFRRVFAVGQKTG